MGAFCADEFLAEGLKALRMAAALDFALREGCVEEGRATENS